MAKRIVILGAGESGVGAALLAQQQNYEIFVSDLGAIQANYKEELRQSCIAFEEGRHSEALILNADLVVKSPGIPEKASMIQKIRSADISIISEIEFACQFVQDKTIIGITGSNGKTTTTSLTYQVLKDANLNVAVAGNIGKSLARTVAKGNYDYYVLEISSFQLDDIQLFKPDIAVLMNITPDHLDRYEYSFDNYAKSKFKIISNQNQDDHFVYCEDDETIIKYLSNMKTKTIQHPFSIKQKTSNGAFVAKNQLIIESGEDIMEMTISELGLKGKHNLYNSMAAGITGRLLNLRKLSIRNSMRDFTNLEHRLEKVLTIRGVDFINDSKATNMNSVWYALETMKKPVVWIAGGVDKGNDYSLIEDLVKNKVKAIISLGDEVEKIHTAFENKVPKLMNTKTMKEAVQTSFDLAERGDVVLLAPACASFDLFENYEDRGKQFKQAVKQL